MNRHSNKTEVFERSRSKSSPLDETRSKLAKTRSSLAGISTRVASFDGDLLIGNFLTGFTLTGQIN